MLNISLMEAPELEKRLNDQGVRVLAIGPTKLRAVTHYHITSEDIDHALAKFQTVVAG